MDIFWFDSLGYDPSNISHSPHYAVDASMGRVLWFAQVDKPDVPAFGLTLRDHSADVQNDKRVIPFDGPLLS